MKNSESFKKTIKEAFLSGMREGDGVPVKITQKAAGATPQSVAELISKMNPDVFHQFIGSLKKTGLEILFGDQPVQPPIDTQSSPELDSAPGAPASSPASSPMPTPAQDLKDL